MHKAAVESTVRRRSGSQIARSRVPCARQFSGARMERASVRFASRCGRVRLVRLHLCIAFCKRCATRRSNRPSAAATAR
eukprot:8769252-Lingulodinium_polyedra.AAC.1